MNNFRSQPLSNFLKGQRNFILSNNDKKQEGYYLSSYMKSLNLGKFSFELDFVHKSIKELV